MKKHEYVFSCVIMMAVVLASWKAIAQSPVSTPRKVLFIGDSFTYTQGGIYTHFEKLAAAATPALVVSTDKAVAGGAYLKRLWEMQEPVRLIDSGAFDVVVLQDDIPETNLDYFRQYARMGIQVASTEDVLAIRQQWNEAGLVTRDEMQTNCCFAIQDKAWVQDPDGNQWEVFVVLKDNLPESPSCCGSRSDQDSLVSIDVR